jgi:cysteinyl-tRNA synthetase
MVLRIYNTITRKKEEFKPLIDNNIRMYVCGMTVYSDAHIGHARTYFAFDVIRRYLEYKGFKVKYVQNITDVDDKIINAANKQNINALEYSKKFADKCLKDLDNLGIKRADHYPKASETIPEMIEMIKKIIENKYGYVSKGDVYFSVEKFKEYGALSGQKLNEMKENAGNLIEIKKHKSLDFALWKKAKPGEPYWDSPWGKGRPGWHIECSAMSSKYLGLPFDIHGGGMDLRFPHHENEIAQAFAASGKKFANFWIHIGLLTVNGEKMSKSLGNIINIKDLLKNWDPGIIRFFFVQTHYRKPPDFSEKALINSEKGLDRIYRLKEKLEKISDNKDSNLEIDSLNQNEKKYYNEINSFKERFKRAMDDDINTPEAVANLFEFVNKSNKFLEDNEPNILLCNYAYGTLINLGSILTLFQEKTISEIETIKKLKEILKKYKKNTDENKLNLIIDHILKIREEFRNNKDWESSDNIRIELEEIGFEIQDSNKGPIWRKK